ncbi:MAG: Flp pilus assembly complex ATPase component TadA, partial [Parcubacteria group bacterium]|nr:Flp pilus assembly complex ATPase component TadA [Parcubacteria group bacterium]
MPEPVAASPPEASQTPSAKPPDQAVSAPSASATDILHFEKWLATLGERKATDLHLSVGTVPALRIDCVIKPMLEEEVITAERMERIAEYVLSAEELATLSKKKQLTTSKTLKKFMRFRINFFYSRSFLGISMRHIPDSCVPLAELPHAALLSELLDATAGLFVIAGPFDSGRTATVESILSEMNQSRARYVVTLESPIEYVLPSNQSVVAQREVGSDVPSYAEGAAALLEEDADVVVLGAVPDGRSLQTALSLANSGRLVIAITEGNHPV